MWFRIVNTYCVAGGEIESDKISKVAPIIGYMRNWTVEHLKQYCRDKDWELEIYHEQL